MTLITKFHSILTHEAERENIRKHFRIGDSMNSSDKPENKASERVADYRVRNHREGMKRVETTVSADDVDLIKDVAKALRGGGALAGELRLTIRSVLPPAQAATGEELVAFFRSSPLHEEDEHVLDIERDQSGGRTADFE